jgi:hypothetical protein
MKSLAAIATGTNDAKGSTVADEKSVTTSSARIGSCSAFIGKTPGKRDRAVTLAVGSDGQQKTPSGRDGANKRAKGVEPSTLGLESPRSAN